MSGFINKIKKFVGNDDYDDEDDIYEDETIETDEIKENSGENYVKSSLKTSLKSGIERDKSVVSMAGASRLLISVREPITFGDGTQVLDDVLKGKIVVLNLEMLEDSKKRQIFDFVSGGIYSLSARIQKVTKDIFILAPKGIDIEGKIKDQIESNGYYQL